MGKKFIQKNKEQTIITKNIIGVLVSSGIGFGMTLILSFLISLILTKSSVLPDYISVWFWACVIIGSLICGFIASKKCGFKGIVSGTVSAIPFSLFVTVFMLIFSNGKLNTNAAILYMAIIISSITGGIISANTKRRK